MRSLLRRTLLLATPLVTMACSSGTATSAGGPNDPDDPDAALSDGGVGVPALPDAGTGSSDELETSIVVDLNARTASSNPNGYVPYASGVVFGADGTDGAKLLASDGTRAGTHVLFTIPNVTMPLPIGVLGGRILFSATDAAHGAELWTTDASGANPTLLVDANPGTDASSPRALGSFGSSFYFAAGASGGTFLWKTDGTAAGTSQVSIVPINASQTAILGNRLIFQSTAATPLENGSELWTSDGTTAGTTLLKDVNPGAGSSTPKLLSNVGSTLLFFADDGVHGNELWKTDGTAAGTTLVADIDPGAGDGGLTIALAKSGITLGAYAYFMATNGTSGYELFRSDGTTAGTTLVKDVFPGSSNSYPQAFAVYGNRLFFNADDGVHGHELWATDGTTAGTVLVKDIVPGAAGALVPGSILTTSKGVVMSLSVGANDTEGWISDGTALGTVRLGASRNFYASTAVAGRAYFSAADDTSMGAPWVTDGSVVGTVSLAPDLRTDTAPSNVFHLATVGTHTFFEADDPVDGYRMYATDGTSAGTVKLSSASATTKGGGYALVQGLNDEAYFTMTDAVHGNELWKSDGTASGTMLVKDINPTGDGLGAVAGAVMGGRLYFCATDGVHGHELWRTDGTAAGTVMMSDSNVGAGDGCMEGPQYVIDDRLYYQGADGQWAALFECDGVLTKRLTPPGVYWLGSDGRPTFYPDGGTIYFLGGAVMGGPAVPSGLWKTDGTTAGTSFVANVVPEGGTHIGSKLFFTTTDQYGSWGGTALSPIVNVGSTSDLLPLAGGAFWLGGNTTAGWGAWWSDGTEGGTKLLTALDPLPSFPRPVFAALGSRTYFNAVDVAHGAEIWSTDGTANGTHLAADVRPGNVGSGATSFTPLGSSMLFVADDGTHGRELMIAKRRTP